MFGRSVGLGLLFVFWTAGAALAMSPPEGVGSFVVLSADGDRLLLWESDRHWYGYGSGGVPWVELTTSIGSPAGWSFAVGGIEVFYEELTLGVSPVRLQGWGSHGYRVVDVFAVDGSVWIDPTTGHEWGWVAPPDPPANSWGVVLNGWAAAGFCLGGVGVLAMGGRF